MSARLKLRVIVLAVILFVILFAIYKYFSTAPVLSLSVSSDGRYVISAHAAQDADRHKPIGQLVLWDIERKEKTILARDANAFSAAFIPIVTNLCGKTEKISYIFKMLKEKK